MKARLRRTVRVTPADREPWPYLLLPFDVPPATGRLEVRYRYEGQQVPGAPNVIDLGLVDPRGAALPDFPGFRGWSGSARRSAVVTAEAATPGFLPGPLQPGTWHLLLGLARVEVAGVDVEAAVDAAAAPGQLPHHPPDGASAPRDPGRAWYAGDLHAHTHHSDAPGGLAELVQVARRRRLDFLAVTDHNTISHLPHLAACPEDLLLIPGEEVTTYRGHMNAWGQTRIVDFRLTTMEELAAVMEVAHGAGCLVSPNHPQAEAMAWRFGYDLPIDCLEVWHGPSIERNLATIAAWDQLLRAGRRVVAVGGSDYHCRPELDWLAMPTTWVLAEQLTVAGVLDGIRAGRVVLTERGAHRLGLAVERDGQRWQVGDAVPPGGPVRAAASPGVRLITALGEVGAGQPFDLSEHRYLRAELHRPGGAWTLAALTNPIWGG